MIARLPVLGCQSRQIYLCPRLLQPSTPQPPFESRPTSARRAFPRSLFYCVVDIGSLFAPTRDVDPSAAGGTRPLSPPLCFTQGHVTRKYAAGRRLIACSSRTSPTTSSLPNQRKKLSFDVRQPAHSCVFSRASRAPSDRSGGCGESRKSVFFFCFRSMPTHSIRPPSAVLVPPMVAPAPPSVPPSFTVSSFFSPARQLIYSICRTLRRSKK